MSSSPIPMVGVGRSIDLLTPKPPRGEEYGDESEGRRQNIGRAAGCATLPDDAKTFTGTGLVQACQLYQVWTALHKKRSTESVTDQVMNPLDIEAAQTTMKQRHMTEYTQYQTPDPATLGWQLRNYERGRYAVNDLAKVKSMCPQTVDGLATNPQPQHVVAIDGGGKLGVTTDGGNDGNGKQNMSYQMWQRKIELLLAGEHLVGMKMRPDGSWVNPMHLNIYRSHLQQYVIFGPATLRMEFDLAKRADLQLRTHWMDKVRHGSTLGEAIMDSRQMMHVLIHYQLHPSKKEAELSKSAVANMISAAMSRAGGPRKEKAQPATPRKRKPEAKPNTPNKQPRKAKPDKDKPACTLYNSEAGCQRANCRFRHVCSKCGKKNCKATTCKN